MNNSRCTPTASEILLELASLNYDHLSPTIDFLLLEMLQPNLKAPDFQGEIPVLSDEILASNFSSINESSIENVELKNKLFKHDSSVESLKSPGCYINPNTLIEEYSSKTKAKSSFEITYSCEICFIKFNNKHELFKHKCTFSSETSLCNTYAKSVSPMEHCSGGKPVILKKSFEYVKCEQTLLQTDFKRNIHAASSIQCDVSKQKFSEKEHHTQNMRKKTGKKFYHCDTCKGIFLVKEQLNRHMQTHTKKKPYQCDICKGLFSGKENIIRHMRTHTRKKPAQCTALKERETFSLKGTLTRYERMHTSEKHFQCDVCRTKFLRKENLTQHMFTHTGENFHQCVVCERKFSRKEQLNFHMHIHTGETPYKCDICREEFSRICILTQHIRAHTGEKLYQCDVCQRNFVRKISLRRHMVTHSGHNLYECVVCESNFSTKDHLFWHHMRTHTGETNNKCDICSGEFSPKCILTGHMRRRTE
ncbi:hypothetical protein TNIN_41801 [Trichonephila inaurata madagascariensis]|uniref:C2H2-type domain-containing protein n=1 Tax=Trichonephila inaurata madagascariensis TaxID=2747483 RepID=A0A8X6MBD3_9ARAC|nr:hypothetical protein TNIN_41801 [Trichonephila inaurata madagascariensis]